MKRDDTPAIALPPEIQSAYEVIERAIITFRGRPVGTAAAVDTSLPAANYSECFTRDFLPVGLLFLIDDKPEIVRNFLETTLEARKRLAVLPGHIARPTVLPASFKVVVDESGNEEILADFGDRAIGRVAPVDSIMWWVFLLARYVEVTDDTGLAKRPDFQGALRGILNAVLRDRFEIFPTLATPDGCFMIDRRMGINGHPLEVQALFYGLLKAMRFLLAPVDDNRNLLELVQQRGVVLRNFVRKQYWLDLDRLNQIHRFRTEQFGHDVANVLNVHPESIPEWVFSWMPDRGGYFAGNIGLGRLDFRFFALGNLLAVTTGLSTPKMASHLLDLFEARWADLMGSMPVKICYPALQGMEWQLLTGCDAKNVPWSYHNAGSWPCLLYNFTAAALRAGRPEVARRAYEIACARLAVDKWPEYYDGRGGRLIGRRSSLYQVWSAVSLILSWKMLNEPKHFSMIYRKSIEEQF